MTTIYVPRLIESSDQAEALPIGTVALDHPRGTRDELIPYVKATPDRWASVWDVSALGNIKSYGTAPNEAMVGDRALVPIEAEEEWKTLHEGAWHLKADEDDARRDANALGARRRYTTDWEEA
ncbi:hypothetical protein ABZ546_13860 [Brachybacterium paraconglomeratum]